MNRIKEIIDSKGVKQIWLADQMKKSYNMVNSYVQNRRQPSLEDLFKIARILDVAVTELLDKNIDERPKDSRNYKYDQATLFKVAEENSEYAVSYTHLRA